MLLPGGGGGGGELNTPAESHEALIPTKPVPEPVLGFGGTWSWLAGPGLCLAYVVSLTGALYSQ